MFSFVIILIVGLLP
uniref:Uncharacterized protein n=1 Tax=Anguilla anguilla TaxID=7936 RepID=A0A0E9VFZ7_ANGAN